MADDYLMMARVLDREWDKWAYKNLDPLDTGITMLRAKRAFTDAFMAGFYLKLTKAEET